MITNHPHESAQRERSSPRGWCDHNSLHETTPRESIRSVTADRTKHLHESTPRERSSPRVRCDHESPPPDEAEGSLHIQRSLRSRITSTSRSRGNVHRPGAAVTIIHLHESAPRERSSPRSWCAHNSLHETTPRYVP